jgi:hypothetical protein
MDTIENKKPMFFMHIMDGYSFRNTIGIIRSETDFATMVLSPKSIEISFVNSSKCAVHKISLNPTDFAVYRYNVRDSNGELLEEYPFAFSTTEFFNTTKGLGRRDSIRIYLLVDDNKLSIQPIKMGTKEPGKVGALFVKLLTMEHIRYSVSNYISNEPNVRVQAKDFADLCSQASTLKCASLEIIGEKNAVTFMGMSTNNSIASINRFTSQSYIQEPEINCSKNLDDIDHILNEIRTTHQNNKSTGITLNIINNQKIDVKVPISTVKSLSKIHNISATGSLIKFYFEIGKPIKLECPIGIYGIYNIFIK